MKNTNKFPTHNNSQEIESQVNILMKTSLQANVPTDEIPGLRASSKSKVKKKSFSLEIVCCQNIHQKNFATNTRIFWYFPVPGTWYQNININIPGTSFYWTLSQRTTSDTSFTTGILRGLIKEHQKIMSLKRRKKKMVFKDRWRQDVLLADGRHTSYLSISVHHFII